MEERTIVLLGKTGVGKSATGNTILGRNAFESRLSINSVTERCADQQEEINGKIIRVVDTPGFFDTARPEDGLAREISRSVYLSRHGVHAFILVFQYGSLTEHEENLIMRMKKVFGDNVTKHVIPLFTHGDQSAEDDGDLTLYGNEYHRRILGQFGGRCQVFNNNNPNPQQVTDLLKKMDIMLRQNGGRCYTSAEYEEARRSIWNNLCLIL